jgi:RNA chaperone Hfq
MNNNVFIDFVQALIEKKAKVNIYLISGIKLVGIITKVDDDSILLEATSQLVRVSAISTISEVVTKA